MGVLVSVPVPVPVKGMLVGMPVLLAWELPTSFGCSWGVDRLQMDSSGSIIVSVEETASPLLLRPTLQRQVTLRRLRHPNKYKAGRTFITRVCLREVLFKDELQDDAIDIWFAILEEENVETKWLYIYSWAQVDLKQHQFVEYNSMKNVPGFMESTDNLYTVNSMWYTFR
ncbi:hypothetical protein QJS10_CPA06g01164 [Acorus calamus]|uniref:Uncharacterized protein n=1 Tax=Acorus calamus TaxID=4465 RepID=A0AAV9EJV2_ACOCL|nr:hypothetical protein QJS10_CPA06g01164 [Acorus calamus]